MLFQILIISEIRIFQHTFLPPLSLFEERKYEGNLNELKRPIKHLNSYFLQSPFFSQQLQLLKTKQNLS